MSPHELGLVDAARAIRRKELSPVDLVDALLDRAAKVDGPIQAWALLDRGGARAAARRAADEIAR
jgi:Asp-tRNA(Asn)/Glu-tRNA(Gln) amidotransferase A subunit family amidase